MLPTSPTARRSLAWKWSRQVPQERRREPLSSSLLRASRTGESSRVKKIPRLMNAKEDDAKVDCPSICSSKEYQRGWINRPPISLSSPRPVSYTHLRAHETKPNLVCRLLLEKK